MPADPISIGIPFRHWKTLLAVLLVLTTAAAVILDEVLLAAIPLGLLFMVWAVYDIRAIFGLYFTLLPFSVEMQFSNGLGTDLPTEPVLVGLAGLTVLFLVKNIRRTSGCHRTQSASRSIPDFRPA